MAIKIMNIRNESICKFLKDNLVALNQNQNHAIQNIIDNPILYLRNEIIIKKGAVPNSFNELVFEVEDQTALGRIPLLIIYKYSIDTYDDVSDELIRTEVGVKLNIVK